MQETTAIKSISNQPNHDIGEEERFDSDFYDYLDSKENSSRYSIGVDALLRDKPEGELTVADLGCGRANIAKFLPERVRYIGVDHSQSAIDTCKSIYPQQSFIVGDALSFLETGEAVDAIVCCGFLFHNVDKDTLARNDDQRLIKKCLAKLEPGGYLIIIAPFAYSDAEEYQLFDQASWKLSNIELVLKDCNIKRVWQSMALQVGAGKHASEQSCVPDWWVPSNRDGNTNRYSGTYLGSWTLLLQELDNGT